MVNQCNGQDISGDGRQALRARNIGIIVSKEGYFVHPFVRVRPVSALGIRAMDQINGIVVHQTGGKTLAGALATAAAGGGIGAHFYIDLDGTIYQAASMFRRCSHVGLLKPRCLAEFRCNREALARMQAQSPKEISAGEYKKDFPDRYPSNADSIGIELVGDAGPKGLPGDKQTFEAVTDRQNLLLKWLVAAISRQFSVRATEVYRHPALSWKNLTEASTAKW